MNTQNHYTRKLKAYQKSDLLPLYTEHATYLLRVLKTLIKNEDIDINAFYSKLDTYIEVATCHEIAINSMSSLELATHQNPRGKEREYTNHHSAKKVGRDLRVRLIWKIIQDELTSDKTLSEYETYSKLEMMRFVACPYCGTHLIEQERVDAGEHLDGTADFYYQNVWGDVCEHCLMYDTESTNDYINYDLENIINDLEESVNILEENGIEFTHIFDVYDSNIREYLDLFNIDHDFVAPEDDEMNGIIVIEDSTMFISALQHKVNILQALVKFHNLEY